MVSPGSPEKAFTLAKGAEHAKKPGFNKLAVLGNPYENNGFLGVLSDLCESNGFSWRPPRSLREQRVFVAFSALFARVTSKTMILILV